MVHLSLQNLVVDFPAVEPGSYSLKMAMLSLIGLGSGRFRPATIRAVDGVDLDIRPGERVGLFGANGAGKTTLLRVMAGIYPPSSGTLRRSGKVSTLLGLAAGTISEMSADANIRMLLRIDGATPTDDLVDDIWAFVGIEERFRQMPLRSFSSGMRIRLLFSVATRVKADILLLDEWLSVADAAFATKAEQRLAEFIDQAKILVFASHNRKVLASLCTRIVVLSAGRIVAIQSPDEFAAATVSVGTKDNQLI